MLEWLLDSQPAIYYDVTYHLHPEKGVRTMPADLQLLIGKILSDEKFAEALADNPEQALQKANIEPTVDLLEALQDVDAEALRNLATAFKENQAAV